MAQCECLKKCPFFDERMSKMPTAAAMVQKRLCLSDNTDCARHKVLRTLGKGRVPGDLRPDDLKRAHAIIEAAR